MKLCILDPAHNLPGLVTLFPDAEYFAHEPDFFFNYSWTGHRNARQFQDIYGFAYRTDWDSILKQDYTHIFCVMPLLDAIAIPKHAPLKQTPMAENMLQKMYTILKTKKQQNPTIRTVMFDTYDYDYDPSQFENQPIDIFFKRNYSKKRTYAKNVIPFPFSMFLTPCVLYTLLTRTNTSSDPLNKLNEILWCGGIYKHHDLLYCDTSDGVRNRTDIFHQIKHKLSVKSHIPPHEYIHTLSRYKICLDLMGVGDPNKRTFEIFASGSLWLTNMTDIVWPFEENESFPTECYFSSATECLERIEQLLNDNDLYLSTLRKQQYIVDKYMNCNWLKSYIERNISSYNVPSIAT